jgi:hypothetical protein
MIVVGEDLTKEIIFKYVTSYEIFKKYSRNFREVGRSFLSDFRQESNPSCQISFIGNDLLYTDFGLGKSFRAINFVMALFGLTYHEALKKINEDFGLGLGVNVGQRGGSKVHRINVSEVNTNFKKHEIKSILVRKRNYLQHDLEFWGRFGITKPTLELFNVVPISNYWINGKHYLAAKHSYSYNFYFEDNIYRRKIYQPFSKLKWLSNGGKVVQGEVALPYGGELLIITKSLKDVMTLYELGYTAVAPNAESMFLPIEYFEKQRQRFKRIVILFDNDETGQVFSHRFFDLYDIDKEIFIPQKYGCKDISDLVCSYGMDEAKTLLKQLL